MMLVLVLPLVLVLVLLLVLTLSFSADFEGHQLTLQGNEATGEITPLEEQHARKWLRVLGLDVPSQLENCGSPLADPYRNGTLLCALAEQLHCELKLRGVVRRPSSIAECEGNVSVALAALRERQRTSALRLHRVQDVVQGKRTSWGMLYQLCVAYGEQPLPETLPMHGMHAHSRLPYAPRAARALEVSNVTATCDDCHVSRLQRVTTAALLLSEIDTCHLLSWRWWHGFTLSG